VLGRPGEKKDAGADSVCFPRLAVAWPWRLQYPDAAVRLEENNGSGCRGRRRQHCGTWLRRLLGEPGDARVLQATI
jgi:hypothetical protein